MHNPKVLEGLGLRITRPDGASLSWEEFWETNFDEHIFYWVRAETKPNHILKQPDTAGRII